MAQFSHTHTVNLFCFLGDWSMELHGIDVSHHNQTSRIPWEKIRETSEFCICRAGYGAKLRDRNVTEHMRAARGHGFVVGLYHFFRPQHTPEAQFQLFKSVADEVGCGPGDIVPFVDIEHDPVPKPGTDVQPSWSQPARDLVAMIIDAYADCGVYITAREWSMLGSPSWVLERPRWVAHYTSGALSSPASKPARIWQHRVGPYDPQGPGGYFPNEPGLILDQNRAQSPLPLIHADRPPVAVPPLEPGEQQFTGLPDDLRGAIDEDKRLDIQERNKQWD
jgi:GH25 family lysozyme M1 (1,4-beta-N-acetylmuramidase)